MRETTDPTGGGRALHVVECRGVVKTYRSGARETRAVRGLDLDVDAGEWLAVMGPSGCGKSTLLHLLGGLDAADEGSVRVDGADLARLSEARRAVLRRARVGYVFQFFNLVQDMTVAENVELPVLLAGGSRQDARRRGRDLLTDVGLAELGRALPSQLSGGEQQRVALARALANQPGVLLADEPTGNLDTAAARQVLELLARQHAGGQTIIMVTHDPRVAAAADRLLVMEDGRFAAPGTEALAARSLLRGPAARDA
ncbi:ABC transporter ATP-binding protein [Nocardioides sp. MAHUQ-72]|uniref:ABC transporter ATP-binding protein n=1 Tax=unclassified Nocardioides TaxID=2615069 RepID=UPI00361EED2A